MNKGILLFDIDRTMLDTDKTSVGHNENVLQVLGTSDLEKIKRVKEEYRSTLKNEREYEAENYLKLLAMRFNFKDLETLLDIYYGDNYKFIYEEAVYPEVIPVLTSLQGKYRLGVYSEGTKKFQNNKFRSMNISHFFEESLIFILPAKDTKEAVAKIPQNAIIVDDKKTICDYLTDNGVKVVWLNKKDNLASERFPTIHSLLDLEKALSL